MGPREDALGGVKIPALSPEAEIMSRKCFCVVSASFLLAPFFLSPLKHLSVSSFGARKEHPLVQAKRIHPCLRHQICDSACP